MTIVFAVVGSLAWVGTGAAVGTTPSDPKALVLPRRDLPASFKPNPDVTGYLRRNAPAGLLEYTVGEYAVDGYERAYSVQYVDTGSQTGSPFFKGILSVTASAALYRNPDSAHRSLRAARAACTAAPRRLLPFPGATVGDEAILCRKTLKVGGNPPPGLPTPYAFAAIWRTGSLVAEIVVKGFQGEVSPTDATQLAKVQNRRMSTVR